MRLFYCFIIVYRLLERQLAAAKAEREANVDAAKRMNEVKAMQKELAKPDNDRLWSLSPFAARCSRPVKIDLFGKVPSYAYKYGSLSYAYLETVSLFLLFLLISFCQ